MHIRCNFTFLMVLLQVTLPFRIAFAQEATVINDSLFSTALNEQRSVRICLPEKYQPGSTIRYNVVYILDGEIHFHDFLFIYRFAKREHFLPPLILVALPNTSTSEGNMRDRDFLPEKTADNQKAGGADNFIAFLKNELMPYIDKTYPTSGENSMFGHSLGGVFTMLVLLKQPGLFTNYYCSDPAFPWNNRRIITMAEESFTHTTELDKTLWIVGVTETYRNVGIATMDSVLTTMAPTGLRWKISTYPNETHMSVRLKGIYDGLKFAFAGYNSTKMVEFHPMNGCLLAGTPVRVFLNGSFPDVHYTTDGSEPDTSSKRAPQMIEITGPAKLTVKWLGENKKYITRATGNFELSTVWPALQHVKNIRPGGLRYSYYEGTWDTLPDFTKLTAIKTGIADSAFSLEKLPAMSNFGCVFEGYLKIDTEGYYLFALCSSDGSKLFINGHEIINNDGLHGSDYYTSYVVPLQPGFYPVRIGYFQSAGNRHLDLLCLPPHANETVHVTFKMMYFN
jgi:predicted alpha/beta superfamily hydrolase